MVEQSREDWLRPRLEALGRRPRLVPEQARPVDLVSRACPIGEMDTPAQREVAAAAARTSIANEIQERWPGAPYLIRQGRTEELEDLDLESGTDALVIFGVVYKFRS
ncbi:hypothetical protein F4561_002243 [Lipingzhangella halophila]|uniref:Uncharacterized protein n=1 Tax=Lipingzhangella halophila TaxID=1783352 RepID=A0A7W7W2G3_9ACTN|nr:hypothetical protein [Lipingzhangella halophila]MBB4931423.1 hypothetical protein [Lipingzhangella halophila]